MQGSRSAAPKTVRHVKVLLRRALGQAAQRGHITRTVAKLVRLRRVPRHHVDLLRRSAPGPSSRPSTVTATRPPMPSPSAACVPRRSWASPGRPRRGPAPWPPSLPAGRLGTEGDAGAAQDGRLGAAGAAATVRDVTAHRPPCRAAPRTLRSGCTDRGGARCSSPREACPCRTPG